ncbi:hypothetical protein RH831_08875 [Halodesulfurarchaeum sp. HSR-GB]|uniref:Uncharacterized protein n=1 Tax=Halodesulfurarchaeum formicicum TaxID=1873524 RepID=A0A1J1ACX1_9EURY|nr:MULTISPECIES: hypothetical protein [Halodesulfurarchaeum]APE95425.1 hypothetical protein HSR6_0972 [Halodesulfurarchaeum formicicum]MDR5657292.1 hypothetical protein [Halodesulfurarchaeum sp. HSR-GB]
MAEDTETTWGAISGVPGWISDPPQILTDPRAFLATVVVGWIFDLWSQVLGYIESLWTTLANIPQVAIIEPVLTAFGMPGDALQELWRDIGQMAVEVAEPAGVFAPIVLVGVWLIPALIAITLLYMIWGFLETYLPVDSIPFVRKL